MNSDILLLRQTFDVELNAARSLSDLEHVKVKYLGKKGPVNDFMKHLKNIEPEMRPSFGKVINDIKEYISASICDKESVLVRQEDNDRFAEERLDVTLPGRTRHVGRKHVLTQALDDMLDILIGMSFSVQYGPDIDSDYYNFGALNFAVDHPARDMQDTFYLSSSMLLRTHTSNVQVRALETHQPPIRIIAPGKVYRNETITARSHVFFHQVELFYIDEGVTFADLQQTIHEFLTKFFRTNVELRLRPSYFPFVQPGIEIDVRCLNCRGFGCSLCKQTGWLEVAGAGMVHPEVLKNGGIDPEKYTGFAWGMGVERLVMLMNGIKDIRQFTENDIRFLRQFTSV